MCVTEQVQTVQVHYASRLPVVGNKHAGLVLFETGHSSIIIIRHCPSLSTNNDAVAAGSIGVNLVGGLLVITDVASAVGAGLIIAASGSTTVDLDTLALAGDSVALAGA